MIKIAEIIRLSWEIYISHFKKYLPLLLATFVFSFGTSIASTYLMLIPNLSENMAILISMGISAIAYLFTFAITILFILYTFQFVQNKKAKFSYKDILAVYWPALWLSVVVGLITLGGFLLIIVPGIIFTVWFAFTVYIAVIEKKRGLNVLKESRELSRNRFWPVLARLVIPNLFWAVISYLVLAGVLNLLGLILNQPVSGGAELGFNTNMLILALSGLIASFFGPLYIIVTTVVYREVKK